MTLTELKYIVAVIAGAKGEGPRLRGSTRGRDRCHGAGAHCASHMQS